MVLGVFQIPLDVPLRSSSRRRRSGEPRGLALRQYFAGPENALACVVARSLEHPSQTTANCLQFNPIYFYGASGTGKTELVRALAAQWRRTHVGKAVVVLSGSDLLRSFGFAVKQNSLSDWLARLRSADMLVLDDIDRLSGAPQAQQMLAYLVDELVLAERPVLITGRLHPWVQGNLRPRLASRLASGLAVRLHPPGFDARCQIVQMHASIHGVACTKSAAQLAAGHIQGTVPELQARFEQLLSLTRGRLSSLDQPDIRRMLARKNDNSYSLSPNSIIRSVARYYKVPVSRLTGPSRRVSLVRARGVAIYLIRTLVGISFKQIGTYVGRRDHTTVLHAYRKAELLLQRDPVISHSINELQELLASS